MKSLYALLIQTQEEYLWMWYSDRMRHDFENKISSYSEAITDSFGNLTSSEGKQAAAAVKKELTQSFAQKTYTNPEAEVAIFDMQKKKLERLKKFKKFLSKTRNGEGGFSHPEIQPGLPVVFRDDDGRYLVRENDVVRQVTRGELMTDYEWGIEYAFDRSVGIHDIREYYLEQLKADLREKLDQQIITSETNFTRGDSFKQNAYREIGKRIETGSEQQGIIAEKMVKNFLKKLAIDHDADFEIVEANAFQDVEQKVDFIIHRKSADRIRGAKIGESKDSADVGIQFTINASKVDYKEKQIQHTKRHTKEFQDIVLVTLPAHKASDLYKQWSSRKTAGGPDKLWSPQTKQAIFRGVMEKVLAPQEIDDLCNKYFS